jgi:hypothetical protein
VIAEGLQQGAVSSEAVRGNGGNLFLKRGEGPDVGGCFGFSFLPELLLALPECLETGGWA